METSSETDDESSTANGRRAGEDEELDSPVAGVPSLQASPRVGHALLSSEGPEVQEGLQNLHQHWRLGDNTSTHLNGCGESHDLDYPQEAGGGGFHSSASQQNVQRNRTTVIDF